MLLRVQIVLLVLVGVASALRLPLPSLSDEERKLFLSDMDSVVDCLIEPNANCHPYTEEVRRILPDLIRTNSTVIARPRTR
ncbi:hypothetical protein Pcinc_020351 [Petrolisthes cinctipes]|uniref:Uncharacterized protein n=1 Tax=Petrolisthes cinctipes TaxID=88211 RepID=A0AAE1FJR9_PETCI|nr:hypothetical protein Pcinc_020351 [Petrolisthes cinctipes]